MARLSHRVSLHLPGIRGRRECAWIELVPDRFVRLRPFLRPLVSTSDRSYVFSFLRPIVPKSARLFLWVRTMFGKLVCFVERLGIDSEKNCCIIEL